MKVEDKSNSSHERTLPLPGGAGTTECSPNYEKGIGESDCKRNAVEVENAGSKAEDPDNGGVGGGGMTSLVSAGVTHTETTDPNRHTYRIEGEAGIGNWNCMQGQKSSSTRMELAAWISALTNNTPIHMGTDSKSMMTKAVIMMKSAAKWNQDQSETWWIKRNPFKKPWGLQPDGDLWESVWEAYLARGTTQGTDES